MEVFKITTDKYAYELSASGRPNRWNKKGEFVIYTGSSRSLSTLELIVHRGAVQPTVPYSVMVISISDNSGLYETLNTRQLPDNWKTINAYTTLQKSGSDWYKNQASLILKIPSAVIPFEYNYILNTMHVDFKQHVKLVRTERYFWDERLPL